LLLGQVYWANFKIVLSNKVKLKMELKPEQIAEKVDNEKYH